MSRKIWWEVGCMGAQKVRKTNCLVQHDHAWLGTLVSGPNMHDLFANVVVTFVCIRNWITSHCCQEKGDIAKDVYQAWHKLLVTTDPALGVVVPNIILQIQSQCNHANLSQFSSQTSFSKWKKVMEKFAYVQITQHKGDRLRLSSNSTPFGT